MKLYSLKKFRGIAILFIIFLMCIGLSVVLTVSATAESTSEFDVQNVEFVMEKGASVRLKSDAGNSGIRFEARLSESDYQELETGSAYTDVKYGMLIAPRSYLTEGHEFTVENVFGENAIYDWAPQLEDGTFGEYVGTKVRITNIVYDELQYSVSSDQFRSVYGSLINILPQNFTREFVGLGYIACTTAEGETLFKLANYADSDIDNNTRSVTYIAQKAYESGADLDETEKQFLYDNYIETAKNEETYYRVEHYIADGNEYVLSGVPDQITSTVQQYVNAQSRVIAGYYLNESAQNVKSGYVYANGHLVLKLYYDKKSIEIGKAESIYAAGEEISFPSYEVVGGGDVTVSVQAPDGEITTVSDGKYLPDAGGTYKITYTLTESTDVAKSFEFYVLEEGEIANFANSAAWKSVLSYNSGNATSFEYDEEGGWVDITFGKVNGAFAGWQVFKVDNLLGSDCTSFGKMVFEIANLSSVPVTPYFGVGGEKEVSEYKSIPANSERLIVLDTDQMTNVNYTEVGFAYNQSISSEDAAKTDSVVLRLKKIEFTNTLEITDFRKIDITADNVITLTYGETGALQATFESSGGYPAVKIAADYFGDQMDFKKMEVVLKNTSFSSVGDKKIYVKIWNKDIFSATPANGGDAVTVTCTYDESYTSVSVYTFFLSGSPEGFQFTIESINLYC